MGSPYSDDSKIAGDRSNGGAAATWVFYRARMRARPQGRPNRPSTIPHLSWADEGGPSTALNQGDGLLRSEAGGVTTLKK